LEVRVEIEINGEPATVDGPLTVAALIAQHTGRERPIGIAVAIGGHVVPRSEWGERVVSPGESVELVGVMQGG